MELNYLGLREEIHPMDGQEINGKNIFNEVT